jgi:3-oxosteroid 1-dehydrogenase
LIYQQWLEHLKIIVVFQTQKTLGCEMNRSRSKGNKRETNKQDQAESSSRRKFVKNLSGGALAAAVGSSLSSLGHPRLGVGADDEWTDSYDWICIGSGFAGCASAIAAHDKGIKAIVLEKYDMIGGVTSQSGGSLWVPMNALARAEGIPDSREEALAYLTYLGSGYGRSDYREVFVDNSVRVFDYLREKADFHFHLRDHEFYYPVAPGSKMLGRLVTPDPFPAETLGPIKAKVLNSIFVRGLDETLHGKEIENSEHYGPLRTSEAAINLWRKKLGSEKADAVLKKDDEERVGGAALIGYAVRALQKRGVAIRTNAAVVRLLRTGDAVEGVSILRDGKQENLRARKGVLLAMGGDINGRGSYGDSWSLAAEVGAAVYSTTRISCMTTLPAPGEVFPGTGLPFGRSNLETGLSHSIVVNRFGERFGSESFFEEFGGKMKEFDTLGEHRFRNVPCYYIFDSNLLEKYSFVGLPPGNTEHLEWVNQAPTLEELASKMKLPADKLRATVARFNGFVQENKDGDFNRDPATLGALQKPPFYGAQLYAPDPFVAESNVVVDLQGRVVRTGDESPIPGLYACGALINFSRIWGVGYQRGQSLMSAAVFGFLAAEHGATT